MTDNPVRWAWARLNADTLFLALLAAFAGAFDLYDPARDDVTALALQVIGHTNPMHYLRAGAYVVTGVLLIVALLRSSVRLEVIARCVLVAAVVLNVGRHGYWLGWTDTSTLAQGVLLLLVASTSALRLTVLLNKGGLVVSRPAVDDDEGGR